MTTLHINVGDREQLREDVLQLVQAAETDTLDEQDETATLQFGTYDDLVDSLTPLRLELIQAIAEYAPESMREAARLVDRDVSDVHSDLKHLETLGVLELNEGGPSGAMQPIVPFDRIEMHIDYDTVEAILGRQESMRLKLLRESIDRTPPIPELEEDLPDDEVFYDGEVSEWTDSNPSDSDDESRA